MDRLRLCLEMEQRGLWRAFKIDGISIMPYNFSVGDTVKQRGSATTHTIMRTSVFGDKYAFYENPTEFYPEADLVLVKRAEQLGGRKSRRNRRRRQNKSRRRYTRRH